MGYISLACYFNCYVDYSIWIKFKKSLVEVYISVVSNILHNRINSKEGCSETYSRYNTKVCLFLSIIVVYYYKVNNSFNLFFLIDWCTNGFSLFIN